MIDEWIVTFLDILVGAPFYFRANTITNFQWEPLSGREIHGVGKFATEIAVYFGTVRDMSI